MSSTTTSVIYDNKSQTNFKSWQRTSCANSTAIPTSFFLSRSRHVATVADALRRCHLTRPPSGGACRASRVAFVPVP
eukprot:2406383-Prymnesium_polylepis.1